MYPYDNVIFLGEKYRYKIAAEDEHVAALKEYFTKDELCKNWVRGCCRKTHCKFAHGNHDGKEVVLHFNLPYKSKMCKEFSKSKVCTHGPNGAACWFSHNEPKKAKCQLSIVCGGACFGDLGEDCPFRHFTSHYWH